MNSDRFGRRSVPSPRAHRQSFGVSWWKSIALLLPFLVSANTQEIGVEICACAPGSYEFTLDFSLFCPPVNITVGDTVAATSCLVNPFGDPQVSDLIPVAVQSIDVLELNQDLQIIVQENIAGNFGDGDTFQYVSIAALPGQIVNPNDIPRAIQLNILGVNQFDEPIINVYLITFTNNCGRFPVLFEGQFAGWTRFSDLQPPDPQYCPIAGPPTEVPTPSPTPPTEVPTPSPTPAPTPPGITPLPTPPPTPPPTPLPTPPPTDMVMSMDLSMSMGIYIEDNYLEGLEAMMEFGMDTTRRKKGKGDNSGEMKMRDPEKYRKGTKGGKGSKGSKSTKGQKGGKSGKTVKAAGPSEDASGKGSKGSKSGSDKETKGQKGGSGKGGSGKGGSGKGGSGKGGSGKGGSGKGGSGKGGSGKGGKGSKSAGDSAPEKKEKGGKGSKGSSKLTKTESTSGKGSSSKLTKAESTSGKGSSSKLTKAESASSDEDKETKGSKGSRLRRI